MNDWELIQQYAKTGSEPAFAELVQRHLAWVYSAALRQVGQPQLAEEVAQSVFVLLARKAGGLRSGTIVGGWLFRTTRFVASRASRAEFRRMNRHQTVSIMTAANALSRDNEANWEQLAPHLEQAVAALSGPDRAAILLRFYEKKPLQEVGKSLGITEDAAKKRVRRAVDKLRTFLARRGVSLGAAAILSILALNTVQAAPAALATGVINAATSGTPALPQLARETLRAWRWAKIKVGAGLVAASVALIFVTMNAGGWLSRHASPSATPRDNSSLADSTMAAPRTVAAPSTSASNNPPTPKKTGAITGLVLDDQGHPGLGRERVG